MIIPEEIKAALREAFPHQSIEAVTPLSGGRSGAAVFGFSAGGARWVVRKGEARAARCLRIASDLGVAPRLRFAKGEIAIMEHVDGVPLHQIPNALPRVGGALRTLHAGPGFPESINAADFLRLIGDEVRTRTGHAFAPSLVAITEECAEITARFPVVPCHRDLNPGNVILTADRVFFVDWDTAGAGDPFLDLAQLAVFGFPMPEARAELLAAYLGRAPNEEEAARAVVARPHALAFYAAGFAYVHALLGKRVDSEPLPLPELFKHLGEKRQDADPSIVSASLLAAAEAAHATRAFAEARRLIA